MYNNNNPMAHFVSKLAVMFFFTVTVCQYSLAQQNHFIYLQTENKQPFYARLDKKVFSSSASGYLIIPKLQSGVYTLILGFPKSEWPEQVISCAIDKKDIGFILKNFGDRGWGLFNWQTMDVVMAQKKQDEQKPVIQEEGTPVKNEINAEASPKQIHETESLKQVTPVPLSPVKKIADKKNEEGIEMMYTDVINGELDTIQLFIPVKLSENNFLVNEVKAAEVKTDKPETATPVIITNDTPKLDQSISPALKTDKEEKAVVANIQSPLQVAIEEPIKNTSAPPQPAVKALIPNSDCKDFASNDDFMKLRKKMAAEDSDDDMVHTAQKFFKIKCFTVEQIKNLSVLFLNNNGKYKFLDAAYPFVSDSYNFSSLQTLLTDEYYITRFKAMLRH
jgi:hypothetical protein